MKWSNSSVEPAGRARLPGRASGPEDLRPKWCHKSLPASATMTAGYHVTHIQMEHRYIAWARSVSQIRRSADRELRRRERNATPFVESTRSPRAWILTVY